MRLFKVSLLSIIIVLLPACSTTKLNQKKDKSTLFYTNKTIVTRAIISVLHSNNYTVDLADNEMGILNASKMEETSLGSQLIGSIANSGSVTTANTAKLYFYIEPINDTTTNVKLNIKYGSIEENTNDDVNTRTYKEYSSENKSSYQKWFSDIAFEIKKRLSKTNSSLQ